MRGQSQWFALQYNRREVKNVFTLCKNDKEKMKKLIQNQKLDAVVTSNTDFVDEIILAMANEGIIDCLEDSLTDRRRHNSFVPFKLIMALAIAAKMKIHTSLTDVPYAIQDHRVLAELGFNVIFKDKDALFSEGTVRYLIGKYSAEQLIQYYNDVVQNRILIKKDIKPTIHIVDCTKIAVNKDNENYENSSIARDRKGQVMRGYKLASLRGLYKDSGIIEEIRFGTASKHDLTLCGDMLKNTPCFKEGDILINDKGFLSRNLINYLKQCRKVDTYVPLRSNMDSYHTAVSIATQQNDWIPHPNKSRHHQVISFVEDVGINWESSEPYEDVPLNACVVWDKERNKYLVFVTTDLTAKASDIIKIYEIRPEIEEDFRQLKDFWKLEDFKSTKYHMIIFHIVCVLLGYLFYQLYINSDYGDKYLGKSLPVIFKNYKIKFLNYLVLYSGNYFCCMSIKEFFEFRDNSCTEVQNYLLEFFE